MPAREAGAADHDGGDHFQLEPHGGARIAARAMGETEHAGPPRQQAGQRVDEHLGASDGHAGVDAGGLARADGVEVPQTVKRSSTATATARTAALHTPGLNTVTGWT